MCQHWRDPSKIPVLSHLLMRSAIIVFLLGISLLGCVPPSQYPVYSSPSTAQQSIPLGDSEVHVEEGVFAFKNLRLSVEGAYSPIVYLSGTVENKTSKDWTSASFAFEAYNAIGQKVRNRLGGDKTLSFTSFKKGTVKDLSREYLGFDGSFRELSQISRAQVSFRTGKYPAAYSFVMTKPVATKDLQFNDKALEISFVPGREGISFILRNKTQNPIKIDWNQVAYVDISGVSHKVIHAGVRYIERDKPQPASVVPPGAKLEDTIVPTDYISYVSGQYGGWTKEPLFPEGPAAKVYEKKTVQIFMPVEVNGTIKNYLFTFQIEKVEM